MAKVLVLVGMGAASLGCILSARPTPSKPIVEFPTQAKLAAGWLGLSLDEQRPFWKQFPPQGADVRKLYEAVRGLSDQELEQLHTLLAALLRPVSDAIFRSFRN